MDRAERIRSRRENGHLYGGFPNGSLQDQTFRLAMKAMLLTQLPDREVEFPLTIEKTRGRKIDRMDMAKRVCQRVVDFGLTGWDYVNEWDYQDKVEVVRRFPYGRKTVGKPTRLVLADYTQKFSAIDDLRGSHASISTEVPNLTRKQLAELGIFDDDIEIDVSHGATEGAGKFGSSDLVTDVVETGRSMDVSEAYQVADLFESTPVLIANRDALRDRTVRETIENFGMQFDAALRCETEPKSLLILNVPNSALQEVQRILPGSKGENVSPMEAGWSSVNAEVMRSQIPKIVPLLLRLGADDINDVTTGMRWSQKSRIEISEPK